MLFVSINNGRHRLVQKKINTFIVFCYTETCYMTVSLIATKMNPRVKF